MGLSFFICQMGRSQSRVHGELRRLHETVCPEHQHAPQPGRWLAASTTAAKVSPTQAWRLKPQATPGPRSLLPKGAPARVHTQLLPLQVSVGSAHEDVGVTGAHTSANTCVCSQTSLPRAAPRTLTLTHRRPAAEERAQPAAGGMQVFTCLALPQGGDWGNLASLVPASRGKLGFREG